jgi:redox-sensitive bicupin YhaK (pirin superfamily)
MITLRRAKERGHAQHGWLDSRHTFSFSSYHDPAHMGFHCLRVINEDRVVPGEGFGTHPHDNMEIVSYVLEGALEHKDSMGTGSVIRPGDLQRMSAGTGVTHSEFNHSSSEPVHFLQIWILPERRGIRPGYEQRAFPPAERRNRLRLVASRDGREGSVTVHQDANLYLAALDAGNGLDYRSSPERATWVQVTRGTLRLNDLALAAGDGVAIEGDERLRFAATGDCEILLFDLKPQL